MTVRFRQLSFGSQAKLALLLSFAAAPPMALLLLLADLGGADIFEGERGFSAAPVTTLLALALVGLFFACLLVLVQLLGLALLRLLPWRGPALTLEASAERPDLERVFE